MFTCKCSAFFRFEIDMRVFSNLRMCVPAFYLLFYVVLKSCCVKTMEKRSVRKNNRLVKIYIFNRNPVTYVFWRHQIKFPVVFYEVYEKNWIGQIYYFMYECKLKKGFFSPNKIKFNDKGTTPCSKCMEIILVLILFIHSFARYKPLYKVCENVARGDFLKRPC